MNICSFTGHRSVPPAHEKPLYELLQKAIDYLYSEGCRVFYAGGALGFDTMAARAVIAFKMFHPDVKLRLLLPCKNQAERWSGKDRSSYEYTLAVADEVEYVSDEYTPGCMKKRNMRLAGECDVLVAYCGRSGSGAAQTVRMATGLGKTVYNLFNKVEKSVKSSGE